MTTPVVSPTALTTLVSVKLALRITDTSQDDLLAQLINQTSDLIETFANRKFLAQDRIDRFDLNSQRVLNLKNPPLNSISRIAFGYCGVFTCSYSGNNTEITVESLPDRMRIVTVSNVGVSAKTDFLFATYPTTDLLSAAIQAGVPGITCVLNGVPVPSMYINPEPGVSILTQSFQTCYPDFACVEYVPDYDACQISLKGSYWNAWLSQTTTSDFSAQWNVGGPGAALNMRIGRGRKALMVAYNSGYAVIPDGVAGIANQCVQTAFYMSGVDTAKEAMKVGDGSYRLVSPMLTQSQMDELTGAYRDIPIGGIV